MDDVSEGVPCYGGTGPLFFLILASSSGRFNSLFPYFSATSPETSLHGTVDKQYIEMKQSFLLH